MKILIVEDEPLIAMHIELMVEDFGYHVCGIAASAQEAISLAASERPHIALMDIHLAGGSSGIDAAQELFQRHGISCIFLSANLDANVRAGRRAIQTHCVSWQSQFCPLSSNGR